MADTVVTDELKSLQKELSATQKERLVAPGNASERRSRATLIQTKRIFRTKDSLRLPT